MRCFTTAIIAAVLVWLGCSSGNNFDPTLLNEGFKGITYTNEIGEIIGPVDENDWNLYIGGPYRYYYSAVAGIRDNQSIIPDGFGSAAAYPNPTNGQVNLEFATPTYTRFWMTIINDRRQVLMESYHLLEAGVHTVTWDLKDDRGNRLPPGIYRVIYEFDAGQHISGYGDIMIVE